MKNKKIVPLLFGMFLGGVLGICTGILLGSRYGGERESGAEAWRVVREESVKEAETEADVSEDSHVPEPAGEQDDPETDTKEQQEKERQAAESEPASEQDKEQDQIQAVVSGMTLEEKVAQLFFITPEALTGYETVTAAGETTKEAYARYPVGGIVYFAKNLEEPEQTRKMLAATQEYAMQRSGLPVFLGVDEEGGRVLRIGNNESFGVERVKAMGELAQEADVETAVSEAGDTIGAYLSALGFNVDFAPDADVLANAENSVIGDRSFGEDPETVAKLADIFAEELTGHGILACYKHFPGHGGTVEDSHEGTAYLDRTMDELRQKELIPFQDGSRNGVAFIMVSHISDSQAVGTQEPASLSQAFVTDVLRTELGYQGIIVTDSLAMGAVTTRYSSAEAAVRALQAGCDMLLMPENFTEAYAAVLAAVEEGVIPQERLEASVTRIVRAKMSLAGGR